MTAETPDSESVAEPAAPDPPGPQPLAEPDPPVGVEDFDPRENLTGNAPDEVMQTGYDPPDREPHVLRDPPTEAGRRETPTVEDRIAEEQPDVGEAATERTAANVAVGSDTEIAPEPGPDEPGFDESIDDQSPRSGRLVAPDKGTQRHPPDEPDEIASDRGPAGYASSAEEAAVHTVNDEADT